MFQVCSEASVPLSQSATAPRVPLTGPIRASLVINKKDTHTGYTLDAQFIQEKVRFMKWLLHGHCHTNSYTIIFEILFL